jgi:hypothetical protein
MSQFFTNTTAITTRTAAEIEQNDQGETRGAPYVVEESPASVWQKPKKKYTRAREKITADCPLQTLLSLFCHLSRLFFFFSSHLIGSSVP